MRAAIVTFLLSLSCVVHAEDGYDLWLRYRPVESAQVVAAYRSHASQIVVSESGSPTLQAAESELSMGLAGLLSEKIPVSRAVTANGAVLIGTPASSAAIEALRLDLSKAGREGYVIRSATSGGHPVTAIAANDAVGVLHGVFHFLRLMQTRASLDSLAISSAPSLQYRVLDHWDNLDGTVERGYAGASLWDWHKLPDYLDPRYQRYARACASIGINGSVLTNVNANAISLTPAYIAKAAALAGVLRPYGIRVYLTAKFSAPIEIGGLETADPLDAGVKAWWKARTDEIYTAIPDFGGFLVKANSEGQPGPKDYGRNHAEGANVLADALGPHGGTVIWRAFIYDEDVDPDRAKRAFIEFTKLDGKFRSNVLVQVKNGAIDFMPREPFHPLFGAMKQTSVMAEIQATQEYLGQAKHLVYLGTMWKEFLDADTYAKGKGSTVGKVVEGSVHPYRVTGIASVTNPGLNANWCGHHFSQSNWYASGRLAWNHTISASEIAEEWTRMTFTNDARSVRTIREMMMESREAFVNYTMPMGLHHLIGGDHYAPMPQNARAQRADWTAVYYHQASEDGVGFDRTMRGNKAVDQYFPEVRNQFDSLSTCPEIYLLWFHRCKWDYKTKSGKTLWEALKEKYQLGSRQAAAFQTTWTSLASQVDSQRFKEVGDRLAIQVRDSAAWRDQILQYFQGFSKLPL